MSPAKGNDQSIGIGARSTLKAGSIKEHSIKSATITLTEQVLSNVAQMASVVVLARLLTPQDYGTVAMVTAVTGFVNLFRELGLSSATIQSKDISHDQVSALFWINAGVGALITVVIAALGPVLAWFYHKPELALVTAGISLTSLFNSPGTQHGALLSRQLRFGKKAVINVTSLVAGFAAAVVVALSGGRYWALVASSVVTALWHTIGLWLASDFRPGRFKRGTNVRPLLRFGANMAGSDVFNYFHRNADNILIGRAWGAEQLGFYAKAYSMLMLPMTNLRYPLNRVAFSVMSRIQNDHKQFRTYFVKYCSILAFVTMPFVTFLYVCSDSAIRLVLGPRWMGAVELFSILALVSFIQPVAGLRGTVLVTLGRGGRYLRWNIYNGVATVASFFIGLPWGAKGVAISYCIATYLILHPSLVYAFRDTSLRNRDFYRSIAKPFFASLVMGAITLLIKSRLRGASDIIILSVIFMISALIYVGTFWALPGGKLELIAFRSYIALLLRSMKDKLTKGKNRKTEAPPVDDTPAAGTEP